MKAPAIALAIVLLAISTTAVTYALPAEARPATAHLSISPHCYVVGKKTTFTVILRGVAGGSKHEFFDGPLSNLPQDSQMVGTFTASKSGTLGLRWPVHYTSMSPNLHGMWSLFLEPPGTTAISGEGSPHAHFKVVGKRSQC